MNELQIFENSEFGAVRTVEVNGRTAEICVGEYMKDKESIKEYISYLERYAKNKNTTICKAHQNAMLRIVGKETYGVTEEELLWLDENL